MTSPNPMALEAEALEAARKAGSSAKPGGVELLDWLDLDPIDAEDLAVKLVTPGKFHGHSDIRGDEMRAMRDAIVASVVDAAIRAYLAALPLPAVGEGLEAAKVEDHKWFDPRCHFDGCRSLILEAALKRLSFAAQTTGGTAGRDDELVAAIAQAEAALKEKT